MRNVDLQLPDDLYERLQLLAVSERRSLDAECIVLLERVVSEVERERQS